MLAGMVRAIEGFLRRKPVLPADVRQVLFLEYRLPLGCCVHLSPVFEAIKRSRPGVQIAVATRGLGAEVHRHSPFIDYLIETPDPLTSLTAAVTHLRRSLRERAIRPECVLTGASDQRTRLALLGLFASDGWRGGYTLKPFLYRHPLAYDPALSLIANNLRLARLIGCEAPVSQPRVAFSQAEADRAASLLREANPQDRPVVIVVTQTSGGQKTGWHADRFVQVLQAIRDRGCAVVFVGTAADAPAIQTLSEAAGGIGHSLAGKTTVTELAAVLALSDLVLTLDTGTMHVARAVGVPMVVLGPSWQKPLEWMPLGVENVTILRGEDRPEVQPGYRLDEISAQAVIDAFDDRWSRYPPSAAARQERLRRGLSPVDHLSRQGVSSYALDSTKKLSS